MAELKYEFRKRMQEVHKKNRRIAKPLGAGQIEITSDWTVVLPAGDEFLTRVGRDLWDYFLVSMNLCVKISDQCPTDKHITYGIDPSMKENAYAVIVGEKSVRLVGQTARAAAQASYLLEDLMNFEESPYLTVGREERVPRYHTRMVHSGFSLDIFPNEHLSALAHQGFTAILLFTRAKDETSYGHTDFNDIIRRAADYGLDTYAYSYMVSEKHPDDEGAEEYYDQLYGKLFRDCPGLKGVTLVGESVEFPSKDERTTGLVGMEANRKAYPDRATRPPRPGWFPCRDYPDWLGLVKRVIRRVRPEADIVFWTYNWSNKPRDIRLELIENLPTDISLEATFEMSQHTLVDGVPGSATDYTLFLTGAGEYFLSEAEVAKRRGIPLYSMTNTAGLTWDVGTVPYEPAPYQWLKRFEAVNEAHDKYGLVGLMECHHYGVYPSFISELAKAMFTERDPNGEGIIEKLIKRDWGEEHLDAVKQSYRDFGDAISCLITTGEDQYGPMRIGPSYPIVLYNHKDLVIPFGENAMHGKNAICFPNYTYRFDREGMYEKCQGESRLYKGAAKLLIEGADRLFALVDKLPEKKRDEARRIAGIAAFMGRAVLTTHHVKETYFRKYALLTDESIDFSATLDEVAQIMRAEIENAKATIPLVEFDSRLGYEPSMDYMADREAIEWKIALQTQILEEEIEALRRDGYVKNRDRKHFPRDMWT